MNHGHDDHGMELFPVDQSGLLFVSPEIVHWQPIVEQKIRLVIDLDGDVDDGIPNMPNSLIYIYFPFDDQDLPDLVKLHSLGRLAAELIASKRAVLVHCAMGLNRSPLMAGVAMTYLGMSGVEALSMLQEKRVGALYNKTYAQYLVNLKPYPAMPT